MTTITTVFANHLDTVAPFILQQLNDHSDDCTTSNGAFNRGRGRINQHGQRKWGQHWHRSWPFVLERKQHSMSRHSSIRKHSGSHSCGIKNAGQLIIPYFIKLLTCQIISKSNYLSDKPATALSKDLSHDLKTHWASYLYFYLGRHVKTIFEER